MPAVDLDLLVKIAYRDGQTRLTYTFRSPSGKAHLGDREIPGPAFHGRPEDYQAYLFDKIEKLGGGFDIDASLLLDGEIERKLIKLGRELYQELFSPEMRQAYRELRGRGVRSIQITSDEPWIPWELIRPYDASLPDKTIDDDFLCLQFELTRWFHRDRAPAPRAEIRVRRLACILTSRDLPKVQEERDFLAHLAQAQPGVEDASPTLSSAFAAEMFLEAGGVDLLHIAGHGLFDTAHPNESGLPFPDGSALRPVDLQGPLAQRLAKERPLVFLNACAVGRQGWSLSQLGGWTDRWVRVCGCGAFVAPLWPVRDSLALEFAKSFYSALLDGKTFGQAGCLARQRVQQIAPGDPAWLAYSVYGNPNARALFGAPADDPTKEQVEPSEPDSDSPGEDEPTSIPTDRDWQDPLLFPRRDTQQNVSGRYFVTGDDSREVTLEHLFDSRYHFSWEHGAGAGLFWKGQYLGVYRDETKQTWGLLHGSLVGASDFVVHRSTMRGAATHSDETWLWKEPVESEPQKNGVPQKYLINGDPASPIFITRRNGGLLAVETWCWRGIGLLHEGHYLGVYKYTYGVLAAGWGKPYLDVWGCHEGDVSSEGVFTIHGKNLIKMGGTFNISWRPALDISETEPEEGSHPQ